MTIFKAFRTEEGEIRLVEEGSDLFNEMSSEGTFFDIPALEQQTSDDGQTNTTPSIIQTPRYDHISGRFYLYASNHWVTDSDDNYGTGYFQFFENGGTGAEPIYEWEHHGNFYKAGTTIKEFILSGRSYTNDITDLELRLVAKYPKDPGSWEKGFNNDTQVEVQTIFSGLYSDMGVEATQLNRMTRGKVNLDVVLDNDSLVSLYLRKVGPSSSTRYFSGSRIIGVI